MDINRRKLILSSLFGVGGLGLASLATGIPRSILANPLKAHAAEPTGNKMLILVTSSSGDPLNGNVPGTYESDQLVHPLDPIMAPTQFTMGDVTTTAAKPWADLDQSVRDRMAFFHHSTYANTHPSHPKVMRLTGSMDRNEMFPTFFAKQVGPNLETTQREPLTLGSLNASELLAYDGRTLPAVRPSSLRQVLGHPTGPLGSLQSLRDSHVDTLNEIYREHGTANQRKMLDRFVQSRSEARSISLELIDRLSGIDGDSAANQIIAAPVLAAMNVAPVISIRIPFGGDNHADTDLAGEARQTVDGVALIGQLVANIDALKAEGALRNDVLVATLNVFGRTLSAARKGQNGRDHNGAHHVTVVIGNGVKPAVVGGVKPNGDDFGASAFDSTTGLANEASGDVPFEETFQSMAKTIGAAAGIERETLDQTIRGGKVVEAALTA